MPRFLVNPQKANPTFDNDIKCVGRFWKTMYWQGASALAVTGQSWRKTHD